MSRCKILLADDSRTVRVQLTRALSAAGYEVIAASDGGEAIQLARQHLPSLAILDINMPILDGYGVCEELKSMGPPWDRLPIVFLTCLRTKALELLGNEFGAYLHKPVCNDRLLEVIDQQVSQACMHLNVPTR